MIRSFFPSVPSLPSSSITPSSPFYKEQYKGNSTLHCGSLSNIPVETKLLNI